MKFDASTSAFTHNYLPQNRHTYIRITQEGEVKVSTPLQSIHEIRKLLSQKEIWINEKISKMMRSPSKRCSPGETILFRGEIYRIENFPKLQEKIQKNRNIKKYYDEFYMNEAIETLPGRVRYYSSKMNLAPSEIRYKKMRRRWGSCDSKGVITFNTLMLQLSYEHIDYIIVHELAHLRHMNHSKIFHAFVRYHLPNERELRTELKSITPHVF